MVLFTTLLILWFTCGFMGLIALRQAGALKAHDGQCRITLDMFFILPLYGPFLLILALIVLFIED